MRDENKSNAGFAVDSDEFVTHRAAEFQIQRAERFVEEQNFGLINNRAGDSDTLLLPAAEFGNVVIFVAFEVDELERVLDFAGDVVSGLTGDFRTEGDIFGNVHVREQGIFLEDGVNRSSVGRHGGNVLAVKNNLPRIRRFETADNSEQSRFPAAGGAEQRHKFVFVNREVDFVEHLQTAESFNHVFQANQFPFHSQHPFVIRRFEIRRIITDFENFCTENLIIERRGLGLVSAGAENVINGGNFKGFVGGTAAPLMLNPRDEKFNYRKARAENC